MESSSQAFVMTRYKDLKHNQCNSSHNSGVSLAGTVRNSVIREELRTTNTVRVTDKWQWGTHVQPKDSEKKHCRITPMVTCLGDPKIVRPISSLVKGTRGQISAHTEYHSHVFLISE
jgi:hypothetical protein